MKKQEDVLEKLKKYPESISITPGLEQPAVQLAEQLYGQLNKDKHTKRSKGFNWKVLTSACACFLGVVCLIVFFSDTPSIFKDEQYYVSTDVEVSAVEDLTSFLDENDLDCKYYASGYMYTAADAYYLIEEPERVMYLVQETLFLSDKGGDIVTLGIVFEAGKYQRFERFEELQKSIVVLDIVVEYSITSNDGINTILSSYIYDGVVYYLEIQTCGEEEILEFYVTQLFS